VTGRPGIANALDTFERQRIRRAIGGRLFRHVERQQHTVRCFVTRAALTDKAQGSGQAESLDVFHEYRIEIENLASAKYDAGKIKSDGLVVVDSPDLNPEQFQQGLA
jgi:hypothetical protein